MAVDDLYRAGQEAWPEVVVDRGRFAAAVARSGVAEEGVRGADLYLAVACLDGDTRAIETVRGMLEKQVRFAAKATTASPDQIAEVTATLARVLFAGDRERPAALQAYTARGALEGYLRVMARRELVRVVNADRRQVPLDDQILDRVLPASDPEISLLRERFRGDVDQALRAAVGALDERERALLRYAFVDDLTVEAIGKLYGVHRATAARWVAAARDRLGVAIRDELAAILKISVDEVDSIVRLVQSKIDVSLERALRQ